MLFYLVLLLPVESGTNSGLTDPDYNLFAVLDF